MFEVWLKVGFRAGHFRTPMIVAHAPKSGHLRSLHATAVDTWCPVPHLLQRRLRGER